MQKLWTLSRAIARSDQLFFPVSSLADPGGRIRFKAGGAAEMPVSAADGVDGQGALQAKR